MTSTNLFFFFQLSPKGGLGHGSKIHMITNGEVLMVGRPSWHQTYLSGLGTGNPQALVDLITSTNRYKNRQSVILLNKYHIPRKYEREA